jgi:hypothetical protein
MEIAQAWSELNWLAVIAAAFSTFLIGGVWYSIFDRIWTNANGFATGFLKSRNMPVVFSISLVLSLVMALNLALFVGKSGVEFGLIAGFLTGLGWVVPAFGIVALFEKRPFSYLLVNGGYMVVAFILMGAIVGFWK